MKKKTIAMLLAVSMCLTSLAGCGGDGKKAEKKDQGEFINTFTGSWPESLDPSTKSDLYGTDILYNITEPLLRIQDMKDGEEGAIEVVEAGAESYEISDDEKVYTLHLRDNKWTDGEPVTAEDYVYGMQRSISQEAACPNANFLYYIVNGEAINTGKKKPEELGVKALDDKTIEITLEHPTPFFLQLLTQRPFLPQRKDLYEKYGDTYGTDPEKTPQCGPFVIDEWVINSKQEFKKNPDYWDAENIKLDNIHVKVLQDSNTIYNSLAKGEIDFCAVADPKRRKEFENNKDFIMTEVRRADTGYLLVNCKDSSNLKNAKMRQAVSIAIDRQEVIDATEHGVPIPGYDFVPPVMHVSGCEETFNKEGEGWVKKLMDENPDPRKLFIEGLKEAGLDPDPGKFTLRYLGAGNSPEGRQMTECIAGQIQDVLGVKVDAQDKEWNAFMNDVQADEYDVANLALNAGYDDPSDFLSAYYSKAPNFDTGYANADYDKYYEESQCEPDLEKRSQLLHDAEKLIVYDDAVAIPLQHRISYRFTAKYVKDANISMFCTTGWRNMSTADRK